MAGAGGRHWSRRRGARVTIRLYPVTVKGVTTVRKYGQQGEPVVACTVTLELEMPGGTELAALHRWERGQAITVQVEGD